MDYQKKNSLKESFISTLIIVRYYLYFYFIVDFKNVLYLIIKYICAFLFLPVFISLSYLIAISFLKSDSEHSDLTSVNSIEYFFKGGVCGLPRELFDDKVVFEEELRETDEKKSFFFESNQKSIEDIRGLCYTLSSPFSSKEEKEEAKKRIEKNIDYFSYLDYEKNTIINIINDFLFILPISIPDDEHTSLEKKKFKEQANEKPYNFPFWKDLSKPTFFRSVEDIKSDLKNNFLSHGLWFIAVRKIWQEIFSPFFSFASVNNVFAISHLKNKFIVFWTMVLGIFFDQVFFTVSSKNFLVDDPLKEYDACIVLFTNNINSRSQIMLAKLIALYLKIAFSLFWMVVFPTFFLWLIFFLKTSPCLGFFSLIFYSIFFLIFAPFFVLLMYGTSIKEIKIKSVAGFFYEKFGKWYHFITLLPNPVLSIFCSICFFIFFPDWVKVLILSTIGSISLFLWKKDFDEKVLL